MVNLKFAREWDGRGANFKFVNHTRNHRLARALIDSEVRPWSPQVLANFGSGTLGVIDIFLEPGVLVRHPDREDWGVGQVQSVVGAMVTVNFEDAGKQTINALNVRLIYVGDDPRETR